MTIKGLNHIPTLQRRGPRSVPRGREAALAELIHLEHEKARLERKLESLTNGQKQTEHRLSQVQGRIALLERAQYDAPADQPAASADNGSGDGAPEPASWREIPLEY